MNNETAIYGSSAAEKTVSSHVVTVSVVPNNPSSEC